MSRLNSVFVCLICLAFGFLPCSTQAQHTKKKKLETSLFAFRSSVNGLSGYSGYINKGGKVVVKPQYYIASLLEDSIHVYIEYFCDLRGFSLAQSQRHDELWTFDAPFSK